MNEYLQIKTSLEHYAFFQESVLESIVFINNLLDVELTFNLVVERDSSVRKDLQRKKYVTLRLNTIQVFNMRGGLNIHQLSNPEMTNWGLNEISAIRIVENSPLAMNLAVLDVKLNHVEILWERERKIDVIFKTMLIFEGLRIE